MKICFVILIYLAVTKAATLNTLRQSRDVSALSPPNYKYLPPNTKLALPSAVNIPIAITTTESITDSPTVPTTAEIPSSIRTANGYEYRTVRRLKYRLRTRRDVSHLSQQYLPPASTASKIDYSTPQDTVESLDDSEVIEAPTLKINNDYLPPVAEATEVVPTEATEVAETEAPQDTSILATDGYHYRKPNNPMEIVAQPKVSDLAEYLPPLEEGITEVEGPTEESAILADDGYHYRAVKRLRI